MNRKCSFVTKEIWLCHFKQCITHRFRFIPKKEKSISINTYVLMFTQDVICGFSLVSCILFCFNILVYFDHALPLFCTKVLLGGNVICTNAQFYMLDSPKTHLKSLIQTVKAEVTSNPNASRVSTPTFSISSFII